MWRLFRAPFVEVKKTKSLSSMCWILRCIQSHSMKVTGKLKKQCDTSYKRYTDMQVCKQYVHVSCVKILLQNGNKFHQYDSAISISISLSISFMY